MAAETGAGAQPSVTGHRTVPHTADLRLKACSTSLEACIAEAVQGLVDSFADVSESLAAADRCCEICAATDAGLLVGALDEVIFRLDTDGELPVRTHVDPIRRLADGRVAVLRLTMADTSTAELVGAVPKGVSLHDLELRHDRGQWCCKVTVDV